MMRTVKLSKLSFISVSVKTLETIVKLEAVKIEYPFIHKVLGSKI